PHPPELAYEPGVRPRRRPPDPRLPPERGMVPPIGRSVLGSEETTHSRAGARRRGTRLRACPKRLSRDPFRVRILTRAQSPARRRSPAAPIPSERLLRVALR